MKVKLKTFEECIEINKKQNKKYPSFVIFKHMKECFGKIHPIWGLGMFSPCVFLSTDVEGISIYDCKWIEEIVVEKDNNNKGQIK